MIYASLLWFKDKLDMSKLPYDVWCAQYNNVCEYKGEIVMWQYTSKGKVNGIKDVVDMNHCYIQPTPNPPKPTPKPEPTPTPEKKHYQGEYPNIHVEKTVKCPNSDKLIAEAKSLCGSADTPTEAYKEALNKVYPDRSSWGAAAKKGKSCDVFVGTVIRMLGWDKKYPRGLAEQYFYKPNGFSRKVYKNVSPYDVSKSGDVVIYSKTKTPTTKNKGKGVSGHTCIRGDEVLYEANHPSKYPHKNEKVEDKLDTKRPYVVVLTPTGEYTTIEKRDYLKMGDTGEDVTKLQNYLNWYFNGEFFDKCGDADGIFGENTDRYTKQMQTDMFGEKEADGLVGAKTVAEMQKVER